MLSGEHILVDDIRELGAQRAKLQLEIAKLLSDLQFKEESLSTVEASMEEAATKLSQSLDVDVTINLKKNRK